MLRFVAVLSVCVLSALALGPGRYSPFAVLQYLMYPHAVFVNETDVFEYNRCGNDTSHGNGHVVVDILSLLNENGLVSSDYGCCPVGYVGCANTLFSGIAGCCPPDKRHCCLDSVGEFIGCAESPGQCCGDVVCSPGYGCCSGSYDVSPSDYVPLGLMGGPCCYTNGSNANFGRDYCETTEIVTEPDFDSDFAIGGCLSNITSGLSYCPSDYLKCTNTSSQAFNGACATCNSSITNNTFLVINCQPINPIKCGSLSECANVTITVGPNITLDSGAASSYNVPVGCCAAGLSVCTSVRNSMPTFVGCYNASGGESCCGTSICAPGMHCCSIFDSTTNSTAYIGCCPNHIDCCYTNPTNTSDFDPVNNFFCGLPYNGTPCQVNKFIPSSYFTAFADIPGI